MKIFILFVFFYLANSAEVEKRWGWTSPSYRPSYAPTSVPATKEPCLIADQAKILEGLVRVNLLFVKTTTEESLQRFLVNKTAELETSVNAALRFFQLVSESGSELNPGFPSFDGGILPIFNQLGQLNETHSANILDRAHDQLRYLLQEIEWNNASYIKQRVIRILRYALRVCSAIVKNGCKEEVSPTRGPWRTTRGPWKPTSDPWRPTTDSWRTTTDRWRPTLDPWKPTTDSWRPTEDPWRPTTDRWRPTSDPWRPTTNSWRPTEDPWRPTTDRWRPTREPWQPTTDSWRPTGDPWKPTTDHWKPTREPWRPTTDSWRPTEYPWATTRAVGNFRFISKEMNWLDARDYCNQLGGRLAFADNEFESSQIQSVADGNRIWIGIAYTGLGSITSKSVWRTLCGRPPTYDGWRKTNPREPTYDVHYCCAVQNFVKDVIYDKGDWYSYRCGSPHPFVCQFGKSC